MIKAFVHSREVYTKHKQQIDTDLRNQLGPETTFMVEFCLREVVKVFVFEKHRCLEVFLERDSENGPFYVDLVDKVINCYTSSEKRTQAEWISYLVAKRLGAYFHKNKKPTKWNELESKFQTLLKALEVIEK